MEHAAFNQENERLITSEEKEHLQRVLGSLGIVDATLYETPIYKEHPEDEQWIVRGVE